MMIRYIKNILIAIDQLFNALMFGDPDETISGRFGRRWPDLWFTKFIDLLFFWHKDHTEKSIEPDEGKHDLIK